ncbi:MAG: aldo/keto reductase [Nitrospirales bacterium]
MAIQGCATPEGTRRYRDRMVSAGVAHPEHFRDGVGGLALSSVGLGTYLGGFDGKTDALYLEAVKQALGTGCNVFDSAINYRAQRSERVIGQALAAMVRDQSIQRDEVVVATKAGFLPFDGEPPADPYAYVQKTFVMPGIIKTSGIVGDCHCLTPGYLRHQLARSLANLGLACVDIYYLHNPETQLDHVSREEFMTRMRAGFETLEEAVAQGSIRVYGTATWPGFRVAPGSRRHMSLEALVGLAQDLAGKDHHFKVLQAPFNLGMPEAITQQTQTLNGRAVTLLEAAKALDVYVMANASILQGQLTSGLPGDIQQALGDGTDAQLALQFVRSTPGLGTALVGMKQAAHVQENLGVARRAPATPDQFASLFR